MRRLVRRRIVVALLALFASLPQPVVGESGLPSIFSKTTIANLGHVPITGIFDKISGASDWGKDKLSEPIDPGKEVVMSFFTWHFCPHDIHDIQVWYNYIDYSDYQNVDLCAYSRLGFAGPPATNYSGPFPAEVTVTNLGPADMLGFYILPSTSTEKSYGQNRLPAGPLRKGQEAVIPLVREGTCLYDMRADFPGEHIEQRYRYNICELRPNFAASSQPGIALPGAGAGPSPPRQALTPLLPPLPLPGSPPPAVPASPGVAAGPAPVSPQVPTQIPIPQVVPPRVRTVVNSYRVPATEIYVWLVETKDAGDNRIPKGQVLPQGQNLRVPLPQGSDCLFYVGAAFDNRTLEKVEADFCKDLTVTLTGPEPGKLLSTGTGFYISSSGHVLTNHHVVKDCGSVSIDRGGDGDLPLQVIGEDSKNDLAILQESGVVTVPLAFRPLASALRPGETAIVVGYPLRDYLHSSEFPTQGNVSVDNFDNRPQFQMSAPIQSGNSGGPVFDGSGRVIGIVRASLDPKAAEVVQLVNFAVKIDPAQQLGLNLGVHLTFSESTAPLSTEDIFDRVKDRVLPLNCKS